MGRCLKAKTFSLYLGFFRLKRFSRFTSKSIVFAERFIEKTRKLPKEFGFETKCFLGESTRFCDKKKEIYMLQPSQHQSKRLQKTKKHMFSKCYRTKKRIKFPSWKSKILLGLQIWQKFVLKVMQQRRTIICIQKQILFMNQKCLSQKLAGEISLSFYCN